MEFLTHNSLLGNTIANTHSKILFLAFLYLDHITLELFSLGAVRFVHLKISSGK